MVCVSQPLHNMYSLPRKSICLQPTKRPTTCLAFSNLAPFVNSVERYIRAVCGLSPCPFQTGFQHASLSPYFRLQQRITVCPSIFKGYKSRPLTTSSQCLFLPKSSTSTLLGKCGPGTIGLMVPRLQSSFTIHNGCLITTGVTFH